MKRPCKDNRNAQTLAEEEDARSARNGWNDPRSCAAIGALGAGLALALLAACGSSDPDGLTGGEATAAGGDVQPGGTGVSLPVSALTEPTRDSNTESCAGITIAAENQLGPADIIFAIDNSGSMAAETAFVQENMNGFSQQIVAAAVDARVVVISSYPGAGVRVGPGGGPGGLGGPGGPGGPPDHGVCIDAPLGSGGCPTQDTNLPAFLHVNQRVDSNNALELLIGLFPEYSSTLRPEAQKHLVVVTDDESNLTAADARAQLLALAPATFDGFVFHGIFAFTAGAGDHCDGLAAAEGAQYKQLVQETDGVSGDLCLQDFKPVFDRLAQAVVGRAQLACEWEIPPAPTGTVFDPSLTNVEYSSASIGALDVARAVSPSACSAALDGWAWHYDDEAAPSRIVLCPDACAAVRADLAATVNVEFGCPTIQVLR